MNNYKIRGIPYEWFKSYLTNKQQVTTINNKSYLTNKQQVTTINNKQCELSNNELGLPQDSILGHLLLLTYISLRNTIIFSSVNHFAEIINILYASAFLKDINNKINNDLYNLV